MDLVKDLTKRQREIFDCISRYLGRHGYPPTVRRRSANIGLPSSTVHAHLSKLESLGVLKRDPSKPRALEVMVERAKKAVRPSGLPLVGQVAAGEPILAEENIEDYLDVPNVVGGEDGDYILRVRGDSMEDAGILEGDFVVVRPTERAPGRRNRGGLGRRRGDRQALLSREGSDPAPAGEQGHEADSHPRLAPAWSRRGGFQEGLTCRRTGGRSGDPPVGAVGVTLEDTILGAWEALTAQGRAECPVCHGGWSQAAAPAAPRSPDATPSTGRNRAKRLGTAAREANLVVRARQSRVHAFEESPDTTGQGRWVTPTRKPAGKCHREQTADGAAAREPRTGKGETVR